jgi:hypothetical protein
MLSLKVEKKIDILGRGTMCVIDLEENNLPQYHDGIIKIFPLDSDFYEPETGNVYTVKGLEMHRVALDTWKQVKQRKIGIQVKLKSFIVGEYDIEKFEGKLK